VPASSWHEPARSGTARAARAPRRPSRIIPLTLTWQKHSYDSGSRSRSSNLEARADSLQFHSMAVALWCGVSRILQVGVAPDGQLEVLSYTELALNLAAHVRSAPFSVASGSVDAGTSVGCRCGTRAPLTLLFRLCVTFLSRVLRAGVRSDTASTPSCLKFFVSWLAAKLLVREPAGRAGFATWARRADHPLRPWFLRVTDRRCTRDCLKL
jgi:hypothetical protein